MNKGLKFDTGKAQLSLIPTNVFMLMLEKSRKILVRDILDPETKNITQEDFRNYHAYWGLVALSEWCTYEHASLRDAYKSLSIVMEALFKMYPSAAMDAGKALGIAMAYGCKKYGRLNYRGGMEDSRLIDSTMRHLTQHLCEGEYDEESGNPHLSHCLFGISIVLNQYARRLDGESVGVQDMFKFQAPKTKSDPLPADCTMGTANE